MSGSRFVRRVRSATVVAFCVTACDGAGTVSPLVEVPRFASSGPSLVECPTETEESVVGTIRANGGTIQLENHRLTLPLLAVTLPTEFRLAAPAGDYMELSVKANGLESFLFDRLVTITIDYSRCTRTDIDQASLTVWKIDPVTKDLLQQMEVVAEDKAARTITFQTLTLSSWSIAE